VSGCGFDYAIPFVLQAEGGYVEDDAGKGPTNFGINSTANPGVDVKALTQAQAAAIYRAKYWDAIRLDALPLALAVAVFDGAVQHGPQTSVKLLQGALGIPADGTIGPVTEAAAKRSDALPRYLAARALRYAQHPQFPTYGGAWIRRLFECHAYCGGLPD